MQTIDAIWAKRTAERLNAQGLPAEELLKKAADYGDSASINSV